MGIGEGVSTEVGAVVGDASCESPSGGPTHADVEVSLAVKDITDLLVLVEVRPEITKHEL